MLRYLELKSGYDEDGPAWIARVVASRSGRAIYFAGRMLRAIGGRGVTGNHIDPVSGEEFWVSGVKKDGRDRRGGGGGLVWIEASAVDEYLRVTGAGRLPRHLRVIPDLAQPDPAPFVQAENGKALDDEPS